MSDFFNDAEIATAYLLDAADALDARMRRRLAGMTLEAGDEVQLEVQITMHDDGTIEERMVHAARVIDMGEAPEERSDAVDGYARQAVTWERIRHLDEPGRAQP